ncbi:polysulfide reductase [Geomonas silvestris]|uniref:Polysulfide reductase n=1 Tax=Geomonas silvestris TaxID=2740184 RepID=A0A6V8MGP5_9BACT|nr:NrfD/PsrC family molybdoenzyme membrane anchor subunit [Geomonas silvestris]GFO59132.1 polysulfide reductase [Geomonas silvestris]
MTELFARRQATAERELDPQLAVLSGEAAGQRIRHPAAQQGMPPIPLWQKVPSQPGEEAQKDYYRLPLLKEPVWIWSVPAYFYLGGVAGGSALLATLAHGKRGLKKLAALCRGLAFAGTTVGPALLTYDLGKMGRFLNMLRVFRPSSPMSVGSWSLAGSGALATLALVQGDHPAAKPTTRALAGGGLVVSGYTGVLLGNSANPLWQGTRLTLPLLFTASAIASTSALLELFTLNRREERVVRRFGTIGKIAEAGSMALFELEAAQNPEAARALDRGKAGVLWKGAKGFLAAGIALSLLPGDSVGKRRAAGTLTTIGALCLRFGLLEAGKEAVRDPQAVITPQLKGLAR